MLYIKFSRCFLYNKNLNLCPPEESHVHSTGSVAVMASGMERRSVHQRPSHVHSTGSVAVMATGMGRHSVHQRPSHVHSTGSVAVMATGTGAWGGILSTRGPED
ncbi:hypothetical protein AVEN_107649-1 [Araneus ventricosus]|uniref:Uncharacterized protein n=1 Tax=Araneus ventricosus TaxID=182803 RepID=A0A4Y2U4T5_ARAVE|nr:hypothetical protein AVEN_231748-1 [Araneus ventricosus]GBO06834.1 hypothetical protein AVEN_133141-1 [Araneus ventricosus]GBO07979.1 hypothetical protein AVEN_95020-1 [Araneus ventricosus]GBO07985.1 hypothetical protein AVEN_107649-1 [Araneus ventricosus]